MRAYHYISGLLFAVVGTAHLIRAVQGSSMQIGATGVPVTASYGVFVLCAVMAIWAFTSIRRP